MAEDRIPTGPGKRRVAKAWNNQRKEKKHETQKLTI
jgi:hypothetical protein